MKGGTTVADLTPSQEAARDRLHDALVRETSTIGPGSADDCDFKGQPLLSEWVLSSAWVDEDGETWTLTFGSANLPAHHRKGLLHIALGG